MASAVLALWCVQGSIFAEGGQSNAVSLKGLVPTANTAFQAMSNAEKLWQDQPMEYFRKMYENAKQLSFVKIESVEDYQTLFGSFTNMISKPISKDDEGADKMLLLQSLCVQEYMQNLNIRNDHKAWVVFSKYIGRIRSQIIPSFAGKGSLNPSEVQNVSPEERKRIVKENKYQSILLHKNTEFTMTFMNHMKCLPKQTAEEKGHFQQLADFAKLTKEERAKLETH